MGNDNDVQHARSLPGAARSFGFSPTGIATGIQIVGAPCHDEIVFAAEGAFEADSGPWFDAAGRPPITGDLK